MAKMSERQREYFLSRVNDEIYNHKRSLELKESSAKEKMVKKLYPKYVEQVGLKKELAELQTLETKYNKLLNHMDNTINRMFEAEELHFQMMVDKLDESHGEYDGWKQTTVQLKEELDRLRYLFKLYGGTLGSEFPVDE